MKSIDVTCRSCGARLKAPSQLGDLILTCPTCNLRWTEWIADTVQGLGAEASSGASTPWGYFAAASTGANNRWAYFSRPVPTVEAPARAVSGRQPNEPSSVAQEAPAVELAYEICPVCYGDGGVRGGCYKCGGNGWVTQAARKASASVASERPGRRTDDSRVSNANYNGNNPGAHYRDYDGRIGSHPDHDDYSEDAGA